jgi:hypothetical protein
MEAENPRRAAIYAVSTADHAAVSSNTSMRLQVFVLVLLLTSVASAQQQPQQRSAVQLATYLRFMATAGLDSEASWVSVLKASGLATVDGGWSARRIDGYVEVIFAFNVVRNATNITFVPATSERVADPILAALLARARTLEVTADRATVTLPTETVGAAEVSESLYITLDGKLLESQVSVTIKR